MGKHSYSIKLFVERERMSMVRYKSCLSIGGLHFSPHCERSAAGSDPDDCAASRDGNPADPGCGKYHPAVASPRRSHW